MEIMMITKEKIYEFLELGGRIYIRGNSLSWICVNNYLLCPFRETVCNCWREHYKEIQMSILEYPALLLCLDLNQ